MKAILVIDTPHDCVYCPCWRGGNDEFPFDDCTAMQRPLTVEERDNKPDWCPLKPMPQKKEVEVNEIEDIMHTEYSIEDIYTNKYIADIRLATDKLISLGWNDCLKEIAK